MQIKNKLTYYFAFIAGTLLTLFSFIVYYASADFLEKNFDTRFKEKVNLTYNFLVKNGNVDSRLVSYVNKNMMNSILGEKILIIDNIGNIHYHSFTGNSHPFSKLFLDEVSRKKEAWFTKEDKVWYGTSITIGEKQLIMVAESTKDYLDTLHQLKIFLTTGLIILLFIVLISGRYFAKKALQPISNVINQVESISETNLNRRVKEGNEKDEIAQLAKTFNRLLARLEIAFELQRNFVSNASHELRTPLSSIMAQLEVTLLKERNISEYVFVLNSILDDTRQLNKLSEGLFDLTLASRDISLMKFESVRADELLMQSRSELLKRKHDYKINFYPGEIPNEEKKLIIFGNEYLLKSAFNNLIDNACKFSADKTVNIFMETKNEEIIFRFVDNGIGIPAGHLHKLFTPLSRAENVRKISGHGLGMALTKKITTLHRGKIEVFSEENKGTEVILTLPIH